MQALRNTGIEPATKLFEISMVLFGTLNRPAMRRVVSVWAATVAGAKRIVRIHYPRNASYEVLAAAPAAHRQAIIISCFSQQIPLVL